MKKYFISVLLLQFALSFSGYANDMTIIEYNEIERITEILIKGKDEHCTVYFREDDSISKTDCL